MEEHKAIVDAVIKNLEGLRKALDENNFPNICAYYMICSTSAGILMKVLEILVTSKQAEIGEESQFPEIISED